MMIKETDSGKKADINLEKIKDIIYKVSFKNTYEKINISQDKNTKKENDDASGDVSL